MTESDVLNQAFLIILFATLPALLAAVAVGVVVGVLQSVMQVQDQAIGYVLKLAAVCLVLLVSSRWLMETLDQFFEALFRLVPSMTTGLL